MNQFEMVAFIVLVVMIASVVKAVVKSRRSDTGAAPATEAETRLAKLEERVKALEAVVGDSTYELKQKLRELEK